MCKQSKNHRYEYYNTQEIWLNDNEIQTLIQENEPFQKIGNALNDIQFNFKSKRTTKHMEYWLIEK